MTAPDKAHVDQKPAVEPVAWRYKRHPRAGEAEFDLIQDDMPVASAAGPREAAWREIMHYAAVYGRDGPVRVVEVLRIPVDLPTGRVDGGGDAPEDS